MRIAVVGTGYVGLVTGTCLSHLGHDVTCVDAMPQRVDAVNRGTPPFYEPGLAELLTECIRAGRLRACADVAATVAASDITILAVGTPSRDGEIDLSYLSAAAEEIGKGLRDASGYPGSRGEEHRGSGNHRHGSARHPGARLRAAGRRVRPVHESRVSARRLAPWLISWSPTAS